MGKFSVNSNAAVVQRLAGRGTVYGLFGMDGSLRYIGSTSNSAHARWLQHLSLGKRPREGLLQQWIASLVLAGAEPVVRVLERCECSERRKRERHWIEWAIGNGAQLLNMR